MQTVETEPSPGAAGVDKARPVDSHGPRAALRLLAVLAALLAFGLFGLLVVAWQLARTRHGAERGCRGCRRRRYRALAGTFVLAGLVLVGSGLTVHQRMSGHGVPHCSAELPVRATGPLGDSMMEVAGAAVWSRSRQILTAPVSGLARGYVNNRGGGLCEVGSMTLAFLPSAASDSGVAVGGVVLTGAKSSIRAGNWKAMARHESRHVTQWATLTLAGGPLAMPVLYVADDAFFPHSRNHFERAAGLEDGGYARPDGYGPRPHWVKVAVIGMLLVGACRRRLRWASRVLTGGAAAAAARQPGLCPIHSTGWFRLPATS